MYIYIDRYNIIHIEYVCTYICTQGTHKLYSNSTPNFAAKSTWSHDLQHSCGSFCGVSAFQKQEPYTISNYNLNNVDGPYSLQKESCHGFQCADTRNAEVAAESHHSAGLRKLLNMGLAAHGPMTGHGLALTPQS